MLWSGERPDIVGEPLGEFRQAEHRLDRVYSAPRCRNMARRPSSSRADIHPRSADLLRHVVQDRRFVVSLEATTFVDIEHGVIVGLVRPVRNYVVPARL